MNGRNDEEEERRENDSIGKLRVEHSKWFHVLIKTQSFYQSRIQYNHNNTWQIEKSMIQDTWSSFIWETSEWKKEDNDRGPCCESLVVLMIVFVKRKEPITTPGLEGEKEEDEEDIWEEAEPMTSVVEEEWKGKTQSVSHSKKSFK